MKPVIVLLSAATLFACRHSLPRPLRPADTKIEGAQVWNGRGFEPRTLWIRSGAFVDDASGAAKVERLDGRFIVPAYANAHHHITGGTPDASWSFVENGVFYVWNPNILASVVSDKDREFWARPDTYDVRLSMGGITEPGGHPEKLYVEILSRFVYRNIPKDKFLTDAFHYGRSPAEIDQALSRLKGQGADFVKAYLLHSEEYAKRRDDPAYFGLKGLNPAHVAHLVASAHRRGLQVIFHIETAADFRVAVAAGADLLAHLPGYGPVNADENLDIYALRPEDAALAATAGVLVIPTYGVAAGRYGDLLKKGTVSRAVIDRHFAAQARNIRTLVAAGVPVLTGTDGPPAVFDELAHLHAIGGLTKAEALTAVFRTASWLFPERKLGCFDAGCAADFLVLNANPTQDLAALRAIEARYKHGRRLEAPSTPL